MPGAIFDILAAGGPVMVLLAGLSLLSVTLIVLKILQLRSCRSGSPLRDTALQDWESGDRETAQNNLAKGVSPADRVTGHAMNRLTSGMKRAVLEAELTRRGNLEVEQMSNGIRLLELIAIVSPLLGLLGTVLGMIQSFQELELAEGAANAAILAGGIWQALLTTAAGLVVAIPAAVAAGLLNARIDSAASLIEQSVGQLLLIEDTTRNKDNS